MTSRKKLQAEFLFVLILFFISIISCSREKTISFEAYDEEMKGHKSQAIYGYSMALSIDKDYPFANKRMGFILSESGESLAVAASHLEIAKRGEPGDPEIALKLFEIDLLLSHREKSEKTLYDLRALVDIPTYLLLENLFKCSFEEDKKSYAKKVSENLDNPNGKFIYRIWSACLLAGDQKEKSEILISKYRR